MCALEMKQSNVYTKGGDKGMSSLVTGERRRKTDIVFETEGILDELNSNVGQARALLQKMIVNQKENSARKGEVVKNAMYLVNYLENVQQWIMNVTAVVSTPLHGKNEVEPRIWESLERYDFLREVEAMEKEIDVIDARLTPLRVFILPGGGNVTSAQLHVCRTVCRRAERRMVDVRDKYGEQYTDHLRQATVYVNRLSDYFFVAARSVAEEDIVRKSE